MQKLVVANWKMNPQTTADATHLMSQIERGLLAVDRDRVATVICPPFVFLPAVKHAAHFAKLGAQNVAAEIAGPHTGEISAGQLQQFGVSYAIIGHSERRNLGETGKLIRQKIHTALAQNLKSVLCVGWGAKKISSDAEIRQLIRKQVEEALEGINLHGHGFTIAYEPVWAISRGLGTGRAATPAHAAEISEFIKSIVRSAAVLYGGSVDGKNAAGFARVMDGALVGGASLEATDFLNIIKEFSK